MMDICFTKKFAGENLFQTYPNEYYITILFSVLNRCSYFSSKYQQPNAAIYIFTIRALFNYSASFPYIFLSTSRVPSISKNATGSAIAIVLTNPATMYETNDTAATVIA